MKRTLLICLLLAAGQWASAQDWKQFSDTSILFTASYPSNWTNKIKEGKKVFFTSPADNASDDFLENINVSVTTNPSYGTRVKIRDLFPGVTNQLKNSIRDFEDAGQRYLTLNNQDVVEIRYSGVFNGETGMRVHIRQWFCFYKTRLYTITFTARDANSSHTTTALKIMNSIKFTP